MTLARSRWLFCALFLATASAHAAAPVPLPAWLANPTATPAERFMSALAGRRDLTWEQLAAAEHLSAPAAKPLSFDVTQASFYERVVSHSEMGDLAKARLAKDGFVILQRPWLNTMATALHRLFEADQPLLVTSDMILDALHRSVDDILGDLETSVLTPALEEALRVANERIWRGPRSAAAEDADLYLSVARSLLLGPYTTRVRPAFASPEQVTAIIDRVESGSLENGGEQTRIYGSERRVDWTQFIPRGHSTESQALEQWFRAMMWLGRADTGFVLKEPEQAAAAALIDKALSDSGARKSLDTISAVIDLFVGKSERFGAGAVRSQVVMSDPDAPAHARAPDSWQLLGQRATIDGLVLSKVVYDDIVFRGEKMQRGLPSGLDVAATVFGNDLALRLLAPEVRRWGYAANLAAAREVVRARSDADRSASLYDRWLDALAELSRPPSGEHVPEVMRGEGWATKMLSTQLASWAQLRQDTLLFVQQSYSAGGGCIYPQGFVEPYPAFYRKLAGLGRAAGAGLAPLRAGDDDGRAVLTHARNYFQRFADLLDTLAAMAERELRAEPFTAAQATFLRHTIEQLDNSDAGYGAPPLWNGWYMDLVYRDGAADDRAFEWDPTIADVHTDATSGNVLEVGTGRVELLVAAIDNAGDRAVYVGPTLSYYELTAPASERMDKAAWRERLGTVSAPSRPAWIAPHLGTAARR
ncbi:MAG: DUF3160 domain-containing protein [Myxococcota bacterium]